MLNVFLRSTLKSAFYKRKASFFKSKRTAQNNSLATYVVAARQSCTHKTTGIGKRLLMGEDQAKPDA